MRKRAIIYRITTRITTRITAGMWLLSTLWILNGCQALEKKQQSGAVAELNGQFLYRSTLDSLTLGLHSEDSLRVAQTYIRQWAEDILIFDNASARTNERIERMVRDYRRTLYAQAYEERLVDKRMPKAIPDSTIVALYEQMPNRFKLDESILHGILVVLPKDAPNIPKLKQWLVKATSEKIEDDAKAANAMDDIEKYVYQYANGYELFTDQWMTSTEMSHHLPIERGDLESKLKYSNRIEVTQEEKLFILQVTDKHLRGEAMPVDYARPQLEQIILNARQVEFLRKERERLYNEAIQTNKIIFFE